MKKIIALTGIFIFPFLALAQDRINYTQISSWEKRHKYWNHSKIFYEYNDQGLMVKQTSISWSEYRKGWDNSNRFSRKFNEKGYVIEKLDEYGRRNGWSNMPKEYFDYQYNDNGEPMMVVKHWEHTKANPHLDNRKDTLWTNISKQKMKVSYGYEWLMELPKGLRYNDSGELVYKKIRYSCLDKRYDHFIEQYPDGRYKGYFSFYVDELTGEKVPYQNVVHFYEKPDSISVLEKPEAIVYDSIALEEIFEKVLASKKVSTDVSYNESKINRSKFDFDLYPNPGSYEIFIKPNTFVESLFEVKIYNNIGVEVWMSKETLSQDQEMKIRIDNFPAGLYIVVIENSTHIGNQRFIKIE